MAREEKPKGRSPDYKVAVLDKSTEKRGNVGAAWDNNDGSISIVLNSCVVLDGNNVNLVITLFPNDGKREQ